MRARDPETLSRPPDGRPPEEQPRWRRDFPIDWPEDGYVARREFTKFLVLTSFAFVVGQFSILARRLFRREGPPAPLALGPLAALPVGGVRMFSYPTANDPCLLVRISEAEVVAFNQRCTHLSCPVIPNVAEGRFDCPCHHGVFELATGRPLAGPPRRPLVRVRLEEKNGELLAVGVEERTA